MEPLRVLQISYDMNLGGAETLMMNIYRNIDRTKVQFDFLLHSPDESAYDKEILSLGGRIYRLPRYMGYNRIGYDRNLRRFLSGHPEYTIIHDHLMDSAAETLRVANKMGRITVAHSHASGMPFSAGELVRRWFRKDLWKTADYRFACSEDAGKWLYRGKAGFEILKNGINTPEFRFRSEIRASVRKELGIGESALAVGTVGRLDPQKNQMRLLDIFPSVLERNVDSRLVIVGSGPLESEIKTRIDKLGLSDKVILTGPRKDVNELLSGFDVFVLTSFSEGLGIALVEAQASGLPCVFTDTIPADVNLIPQLVRRVSLADGNGLWADRILELPDPEINRENCWKKVADEGYDIRESALKLQDFYLGATKPRKGDRT